MEFLTVYTRKNESNHEQMVPCGKLLLFNQQFQYFTLPLSTNDRQVKLTPTSDKANLVFVVSYCICMIIFGFCCTYFFKKIGDHGQMIPLFWTSGDIFFFLVMSFKVRVDYLLACFFTCVQWIPQIPLRCNTCWPLDSQYCSRPFLICILVHVQASVRLVFGFCVP